MAGSTSNRKSDRAAISDRPQTQMFEALEPRVLLSATIAGNLHDADAPFDNIAGVTVNLYQDVDGNGQIDAGSSAPKSVLEAGDIAITSFHSDTTKSFSFVTMTAIADGTQISFTDNGWFSSGGFRANEGVITWTASGDVAAGTEIELPGDSGGFNLSASGDQILAYQGSASSPTFLYAVTFDSTNFSNATSSNTTALPTGLTEGTTAISVGEHDNGYYSGSTASGTQADLLTAISNPSNWTTSESALTISVPTITVSGTGSGGDTIIGTVVTDSNGNYSFTVEPTTDPSDDYILMVDTASTPVVDATINGADTVSILNLADSATATNDFTFTFPVTTTNTVAGAVYQDTDGSGAFNTGDVGIEGVTVTLYASDGDGSFEPGVATTGSDLAIVGVIDADVSGGLPKAVVFYVINDIADLSTYAFGSANNGTGTDGPEYTFTGSATAGDYIYISSTGDGVQAFTDFFGFAPTDNDSAALINGDDAIELFHDATGAFSGSETRVDIFGVTDGPSTGWNYENGWAFRVGDTGPDSNFVPGNWLVQPAALAAETDNASAGNPFPVGTFSYSGAPTVGDDVYVATATTDANGNYSFTDLPDGPYWVIVSTDDDSTLDRTLLSTQNYQTASLSGGMEADADFRFTERVGTATFGGWVFNDVNGDGLGVNDNGTLAVGGVRVFIDINENGVYDSGVDQASVVDPSGLTVTGGDGEIHSGWGGYYFTGLLAHTDYRIAIEVPAGYTQTLPSSTSYWTASLEEGEAGNADALDHVTGNFGLMETPPTITVSGTVYDDANASGTLDGGETGVEGAQVGLYVDTDASSTFNASSGAWINEFHYENISYDANEGVEIAAVTGFDLTGWTLQIYTGNGGYVDATYDLSSLSMTAGADGFSYGFLDLSDDSIRNDTAGFALVDAHNHVLEFISYEGTVTATNGAALGMTSTDVGVAESNSTTLETESIQRVGAGNVAGDFGSWTLATATPGAINAAAGQSTTAALTGADYRIASTTTDANGAYSFGDTLPETDVLVVVSTSGVLAGSTPTSTTAVAQALEEGVNDAPVVDFGFQFAAAPSSIGDMVYSDANGNGVLDGGETGIDGVDVSLWLDGGDGVFGVPVNYTQLAQQSFESGSGYTLTTSFDDGSFDFFGVYDKTSTDVTGNSARDGYVEGANVDAIDGDNFVVAQDVDGQGGTNPVTVTLDPITVTGYTNLEVRGLFGAEYSTEFTNFDAGDKIAVYATLDGGTRQLIGAFIRSTDGLLVFDADNNGTLDAGENQELDFSLSEFALPIVGTGDSLTVEVELHTNDSFETVALDNLRVYGVDPNAPALPNDDTLVDTATTSGGGLYDFTNITTTGTYFVQVDQGTAPANYTLTSDAVVTETLVGGEDVNTADFGFLAPTTNYIDGQVYDTNSTDGIADVTVNLYEDTNNNGVIDESSGSSVTGTVLITGVIDGTGNVPKGIEIYVAQNGTDLTNWTIEVESNGGSSWSTVHTFSGSFDQGYYYITSTSADMISLFSSATAANTIANGSFNQNGNDAFRIVDASSQTVDQFGDPSQISSSSDFSAAWAYADSFAYRTSTSPSATFDVADWYFAGNDYLDNNGNTAATAYFGTLAGGSAGDTLLATTTTDADGNYSFADLTVGTHYLVDVDEVDADLNGATLATANDPAAVTLTQGVAGTVDFGFNYAAPTNYVGGNVYNTNGGAGIEDVSVRIYEDVNSNGVLDLGSVSASNARGTGLIITAVYDGPLTGGLPKGYELLALEDIADLSLYGVGSANNGQGTDGMEFQLSGSATAGQFLYVTSDAYGFSDFFGFEADFVSNLAASINGDDAVELFYDASGLFEGAETVADTFGDIAGPNTNWNYADGWAVRTTPGTITGLAGSGATFNAADWTFSGADALDNASSNATAATPVPLATFGDGAGITLGDTFLGEVLTDASGNYQFDDLTPGTDYIVDVEETDGDLPENSSLTVGADPAVIALTSGVAGTADFGFTASTVSPGITVSPVSTNTTSETGTTATFDVVLDSQPTGDVTITFSSSNENEGTVTTSITFTDQTWDQAQTVTITGVNDSVDDGDQAYTISAVVSSTDTGYDNMAVADIEMTNTDNDTAGITVTPVSSNTTSEDGTTATFTVVLDSQPVDNVTISFNSSNENEGTVTTSVVFTDQNWDQAQTVTITGVDDATVDGDQAYTISATVTSNDANYNGAVLADIEMTNTDNDVEPAATIEGRYVFYNNSYFDSSSDDNAIATDKTALLAGQTATFANYTSYSKGINGVMIDIANLANAGSLSASDFEFAVGNSNTVSAWATAATPQSITVREGEGVNGSDRVVLIWADNAIQQQWLEITVLATANTGLDASDVFYFGNAIGDTGNSAANTQVNATDSSGARNNPHNFLNRAAIDDVYDFNRDSLVNASDSSLVRNNPTNFLNAVKLIVPEVSGGGSGASLAIEGDSSGDGGMTQLASASNDSGDESDAGTTSGEGSSTVTVNKNGTVLVFSIASQTSPTSDLSVSGSSTGGGLPANMVDGIQLQEFQYATVAQDEFEIA